MNKDLLGTIGTIPRNGIVDIKGIKDNRVGEEAIGKTNIEKTNNTAAK